MANPGVDIPADATAIPRITTEQARRDGRPAAEVSAEVSALLAQVWTATTPLCAFNAAFDLTMLDAELQRHHNRRLRARAAAARASTRSWPLLPVTTADSQPVTAHLKQIHDEVRRTS